MESRKIYRRERARGGGNSYEITLIFIAFAFGCNIGCSVIVSQFFGAKEYRSLKTTIYTTLIAAGVLCLMLMAAGIFSALEDSKTPFIFLAVSSTSNIGMDILFVTLFQMSRLVADGILRGAGMMGKFMVATVLSILFYRTGVWFQKEAADV